MNRIEFFGLLSGMSAGDLLQVQMAYWLAKNAHRPQAPRDNGERYFEHPRSVAVSLIERGFSDRDTVVLALLHDVLEDTNTPVHVIMELFGHEVWKGLSLLAKYIPIFDPVTGQVVYRYRKSLTEYYGELRDRAVRNVQLVKIADRYHNLQTMGSWAPERKQKYLDETREYILPIARKTESWFTDQLVVLVENGGK